MKTVTIRMFLTICVLCSGAVQAHTYLKHAEPASHAVLRQAPIHFLLQFGGPIEAGFSRYELTSPRRVWRLTPQHDGNPTRATGSLPALGKGNYVLRWSIMSRDGHRQEGAVPFTVR